MEDKIERLKKKYDLTGQKLDSYLEGLLLSNYLSYWEYIHLDTLLSLQTPKTDFPDEKIFVIYHQITELYFNLCIHELEQISVNGINVTDNGRILGNNKIIDIDYFKSRLKRLNSYFDSLIQSFDIMIEGMDHDQFTKFRMALLPASGFQSAQYRKIEIASTNLINLVDKEERDQTVDDLSVSELFQKLYWKKGAIDLKTNKKTYTLKQFEKKYSSDLIQWAEKFEGANLWSKYEDLKKRNLVDQELVKLLKAFDDKVNVSWPMSHLKSAARYLQQKNKGKVTEATGGTNWKKYLSPRFQKRIFYPSLYTKQEIDDWGKNYVKSIFNPK